MENYYIWISGLGDCVADCLNTFQSRSV